MTVYNSDMVSYNDIELVVIPDLTTNSKIISDFAKMWGENSAYLVSKSKGLILATGCADELRVYCDMHMVHFSERYHDMHSSQGIDRHLSIPVCPNKQLKVCEAI